MKRLKLLGFRLFAIVTFAMSLSMVFHPEVRSSIRSVFVKDTRIVLSTATGFLGDSMNEYRVVKVKTSNGVLLEVYDVKLNVLVDQIELSRHKDAFFTFNGQATNLALDDIDGDKQLDILVPTFDNQLVAHLNVYKLNLETHKFESVNPSQIH